MIDNQNGRAITRDITNFTIQDVTECGRAMRIMGSGASSMEEVAGRVVRYLYDTLIDERTGEHACPLIRFFKTESYESLPGESKAFAQKMLKEDVPLSIMKCLTLLGTVGEVAAWNSRETSNGHLAIPLPSEEVVHQIPMIRNLIKQLGLDVKSIVNPDPALLLDMEQKTYGVFFVPEALGSPYIPCQDEFVMRYGIKSVLGFGGMLPSLDIFVIILFLRDSISRETADLFKNLSLSIKFALLPFENKVFISPDSTCDKHHHDGA
ncbi:MAG TPA: hypothetical protein VN445_03260 [Rectinemataceae bacterium]|nr:hypothetical protein [Rectinemataceae bacterium]